MDRRMQEIAAVRRAIEINLDAVPVFIEPTRRPGEFIVLWKRTECDFTEWGCHMAYDRGADTPRASLYWGHYGTEADARNSYQERVKRYM